jgi:hypothetical protein
MFQKSELKKEESKALLSIKLDPAKLLKKAFAFAFYFLIDVDEPNNNLTSMNLSISGNLHLTILKDPNLTSEELLTHVNKYLSKLDISNKPQFKLLKKENNQVTFSLLADYVLPLTEALTLKKNVDLVELINLGEEGFSKLINMFPSLMKDVFGEPSEERFLKLIDMFQLDSSMNLMPLYLNWFTQHLKLNIQSIGITDSGIFFSDGKQHYTLNQLENQVSMLESQRFFKAWRTPIRPIDPFNNFIYLSKFMIFTQYLLELPAKQRSKIVDYFKTVSCNDRHKFFMLAIKQSERNFRNIMYNYYQYLFDNKQEINQDELIFLGDLFKNDLMWYTVDQMLDNYIQLLKLQPSLVNEKTLLPIKQISQDSKAHWTARNRATKELPNLQAPLEDNKSNSLSLTLVAAEEVLPNTEVIEVAASSNQNKKVLPQDIAIILNEFSLKESEKSRKISSLSKEIQNSLLKISISDGQDQHELIEKLRSVLFNLYEKDYDVGEIWVRDITFRDVIYQLLNFLADAYPVNIDDPISLMPIEDDDKITFLTGQQFSLVNLIRYNKERYCRESELNETDNSKYLINPLTNKPFSSSEVNMILFAATNKNLDLSFLADEMITGTNSGFLGFFTLKQSASLISLFSDTTKPSPKKIQPQNNILPVCKIERDEWNKKDGYFEKYRAYLIENNNCIRRISIDKIKEKDSWDITLTATKKNHPACDSIFNFCAERNGQLEKTLINNGLNRSNPCVQYFPDGDNVGVDRLIYQVPLSKLNLCFPSL